MAESALLEREEQRAQERQSRRRRRVPGWLFVFLLVLVAAGGFFGRDLLDQYTGRNAPEPAAPELPVQMEAEPDEVIQVNESAVLTVWNIEEILRPASELITTKYYYTDADIFENYKQLGGMKIPLTTNKTVFTYDGTVSIGIDFSQIAIELDNEERVITVTLPPSRIIANEIDASSFRYYDVTNSVFNQTEMGDITELIDQLKQKKEEKIYADESILLQSDQNAQRILEGFLSASELTGDYTVEFQ